MKVMYVRFQERRTKNLQEISSEFKNFRQFRRFPLHHKCAESSEVHFSYLSEKKF